MTVDRLADDLALVPAAAGDGDADNRGQVSNLLVALEPGQGWLIGSGPSPAFGRRLAATLQARWPGRRWTVVSPWPHPEAVLGVAGLDALGVPGPPLHLAHADVAAQMAARCAGCLARLRARLGAAAVDLGDGDPVRLPAQHLHGDAGRAGPFDWHRLSRAADVSTTVWRHRASGIAFAPGLLWDGGAPDARDADVATLAASTAALAALHAAAWLGEQGRLQAADAPRAAAAYWRALQAAVEAALERGEGGETAPAALPGVPPALTASPRHALNWQRAWRQAESRWLQRSLR